MKPAVRLDLGRNHVHGLSLRLRSTLEGLDAFPAARVDEGA